ncbi:MAG: hypothetical protein EOO01_14020 [Chitinophagaceae bacterium]|nr:MAG: hypothetical protein EOO01_14020 [Chitinophagaceae bacterium]
MEQENQQFQTSQQGSGSAEQTGKSRDEQKNTMTDMSEEAKQKMAAEADTPVPIATIKDLGGMSRDDASGGSGDRMENESTGDATDR